MLWQDVSLKLDVATSTDKLQEKISLTSDTGTHLALLMSDFLLLIVLNR